VADAPASRAGVRAGDVILEVATRPVSNPADVADALRTVKAGASLDMKMLRDKKELLLKLAIPAAESPQPERQRL